MVLTRLAAACLVVAAIAGCSSSPEPVTDATLITELHSAGVEPAKSIASWRVSMTRTTCESSEQEVALMLTMPDVTPDVMRSMRVAAVHFCPERVPAIDAALAR